MELTGDWTMPVGAKWPLGVKWSGDELPSGVTILSATKTVTPSTGLTVDDPVVNSAADGVTFWATAVTAGTYSILILGTRSDGGVNPALGQVAVVAATSRTSLATTALITTADLAGVLGEEPSKNLAESIINAVSVEFDRYCGRTFAKTTYTNTYLDGWGRQDLCLPYGPVVGTATVYEDDVALTEGIDEDYILRSGEAPDYLARLERVGGKWLKGSKVVKITLTAGFVVQGATLGTGETALPADIVQACAEQCAVRYMRAKQKRWDETSRSIEGASTSFVEAGLLPDVKVVLDRYRRLGI